MLLLVLVCVAWVGFLAGVDFCWLLDYGCCCFVVCCVDLDWLVGWWLVGWGATLIVAVVIVCLVLG